MACNPTNIMNNNFIVGLDLEKVGHTEANHHGISIKDGGIVQLAVDNAPNRKN